MEHTIMTYRITVYSGYRELSRTPLMSWNDVQDAAAALRRDNPAVRLKIHDKRASECIELTGAA